MTSRQTCGCGRPKSEYPAHTDDKPCRVGWRQRMVKGTPEHFVYFYQRCWWNIKTRCLTQKYWIGKSYMTMQEWEQFLVDTTYEREGMYEKWEQSGFHARMTPSVDRIDSSKGYEPTNCRWIPLFLNSASSNRNTDKCRRGHPWTKENIYVGPEKRYCKICQRDFQAKHG